MKREYTIDTSSYLSKSDFYQEFKQLFGLPSYYGENLDDLWEGLTNYIDSEVKIIIYGLEHLLALFGPEANGLDEILKKAPEQSACLEILINK